MAKEKHYVTFWWLLIFLSASISIFWTWYLSFFSCFFLSFTGLLPCIGGLATCSHLWTESGVPAPLVWDQNLTFTSSTETGMTFFFYPFIHAPPPQTNQLLPNPPPCGKAWLDTPSLFNFRWHVTLFPGRNVFFKYTWPKSLSCYTTCSFCWEIFISVFCSFEISCHAFAIACCFDELQKPNLSLGKFNTPLDIMLCAFLYVCLYVCARAFVCAYLWLWLPKGIVEIQANNLVQTF